MNAHAPFLCVVCFAVCDMSEPSPEYGPEFWVKACGGKYLVTSKIGVHWTLAELIYDKYCRPNFNITRRGGTVVHYVFWLFSGGAPASQQASKGGAGVPKPPSHPAAARRSSKVPL